MNDRELEARLRQAVDAAAPDVWEKIEARCDAAAPAPPAPLRQKRNRPWMKTLACAAALLLVIGCFSVFRAYQAEHRVDSVIALDVNPSVELQINAAERVLAATALNDDALGILDNMDLTGATLDVAVNALIGSMLKNGYISELANSILVSVASGDSARGQALQERLAAEIDSILQGFSVEGAVLSQQVEDDGALSALASENQISTGKASLINAIIAQNSLHTFEELAQLSIHELTLLAEPQQQALPDVVATGTPSDKAYIGREAALAAALAHAGLDSAQAGGVQVEMDYDDGQMTYEVDFFANGCEYEYEIAADDGAVLKYESEQDEARHPEGGGKSGGYLSAAEAKDAALGHAGIAEADARELEVEFDDDDGIAVYSVEWKTGDMEYDYEIDALSGAVRKFDAELDD